MFQKSLRLLSKPFSAAFYRNNFKTTSAAKHKSVGVIGVPFSKGQSRDGTEHSPDLLRKNGLVGFLEQISEGSLKIHDYGNLSYEADCENAQHFENSKNYADFMGCNKALIKKVQEILKTNDQILTLGGDHSIGFGSIAGHLQSNPNLSLIWIDAHADINLNSTSVSGNIHGMPVSLLLTELRPFWKKANLEKIAPVCLPADQLVYIGLRDIDPYEAYILHKYGIKAYAMDSLDKFGIDKVMEMTLDGLNPGNKLHVSFDVDALDRIWAPSTGTIVHGGMTLREGIRALEVIQATNRLEGMDLVEINSNIGSPTDVQTTIASSLELLKTAIGGYKRSGSFNNIDYGLFSSSKN